MQQPLLNKRLPSFLGFFFLLLAIGTITWLSRNTILFGTFAAKDNTPKNVRISNITDGSFTVSYVTDANVAGTITFGTTGKMDQVILDDRDTAQNTPNEYTTHYITVKNLSPSTTYTFTITSGSENFLNGESAYQVTTGPAVTSASSDAIITGKATNADGSPARGAIVYVATNNSQVLSTLTNDSGNYQINLKSLRTNNLTSLMNLDDDTPLTLQIIDATEQSEVSVLKGQINPIPLIILSKNYDFAVSTQPIEPSPVATDSADLSGTPGASSISFPTVAQGETATSPQILNPQKDQGLVDQQPVFRGRGLPNETVTITINSEQTINTTVTTDSNGNWQYRPEEPLEPGNHTITIRTIDASGLMRIITQSFVVYAEGSQFTEPSVSPSANPTNTPTPTATATPRATNTPVPITITTTATVTPTPTTVATLSPTTISTTTITATPPPIPVAGNTSLILTVVGIVSALTIGALLFVFATL